MDANNTPSRLWLVLAFVLLLVFSFCYTESAKAIKPYLSFLNQYWWMPPTSLIALQIPAIPFGLLFAFFSLKLSPWNMKGLTPAAAKKRKLKVYFATIAVFSAVPGFILGLAYVVIVISEFVVKSLHISPDLFIIALFGTPVLGLAVYGLVKKRVFAIATILSLPVWWVLDMAIEKWLGKHSYVSTVMPFVIAFVVYPRLEALIKRYWKGSH